MLQKLLKLQKQEKTYGRLFRPTVSSDEYAMEQFNRFYDKDDYAPFLLSALVDTKEENKELAQKTQGLIDQYKEEQMEEQGAARYVYEFCTAYTSINTAFWVTIFAITIIILSQKFKF